jgi:glycosyltransferase involved in cell wall biosynthesis
MLVASYAPSLWNFRGELLCALTSRGYDVIACAPAHPEARAQLLSLGASFIELGPTRTSLNPYSDLRYFWALFSLYRRYRPAAIITYTAKPVIWGSLAAGLAQVPRVVAMITGLGFAFTGERPSVIARLVEKLYRAALRNCHSVVFQNPDDQNEFVRRALVKPAPLSFVVNGSGIDLQQFSPVALPAEAVFLLIARILRDKGIAEFCAAAQRVRSRFPEARFRIVGWFDENPSAISVEELGNWCREGGIEYRGAVADVRPEIAAARIYVLPSYREGTPRTVLEAMAMGRPVVTTDVPGCRETVRDGWNGFLVPARDPTALASAMERFLLAPDLATRMGINSRALAEAKYDARRVAESVLTGAGL